jgi:FkbM family methyltransferase
MMDLLGEFIHHTPDFRGKARLVRYWLEHRDLKQTRLRRLSGGGRIVCDFSIPYEAMVWLRQEEEKDLKALRRILKLGQTFVDCGANIGLWTLTAATSVGPSGKVFAFEPNPLVFEKLCRTLALQDPKKTAKVELLPCALADKPGTLFFSPTLEHNRSRVIDHLKQGAMSLEAVTLDSVLGEQPVHGMKIDVEGFEQAVLLGAQRILEKHHPWIFIEWNSDLTGVHRLSDWKTHQWLLERGYRCDLPKKLQILPTGYKNLFYF